MARHKTKINSTAVALAKFEIYLFVERIRKPRLHFGTKFDISTMLSNISPEDMEKMNSVFQTGDIVQGLQQTPK